MSVGCGPVGRGRGGREKRRPECRSDSAPDLHHWCHEPSCCFRGRGVRRDSLLLLLLLLGPSWQAEIDPPVAIHDGVLTFTLL